MIAKRYMTGGISGSYGYSNPTALTGYTTSYDRTGNKLYERHLEAEPRHEGNAAIDSLKADPQGDGLSGKSRSQRRSHLYQPFDSDGGLGVGYDSANRLLQYQRGVLSSATIPYRVNPGASIMTPITLPGTSQIRTYGLDGLGNWKTGSFTAVGSEGGTSVTSELRQHNHVNEILKLRDTTGGTTTTTPFTYDYGNNSDNPLLGNGNIANDGVRIYQYDGLNRLIQINSAVSPDTVWVAYAYDAFNRRIQKSVTNGGVTGDIPDVTISYLYAGDQIIQEIDTGGASLKANFWGQYIDELMFFTVPTVTTYRVLSDLLYRSVAIVTADSDNTIIEAYDTDAYGNTLCFSGPGTGTGPDDNWFADDAVTTNNPINTTIFTGRQYDAETQIYYYRARYYSPTIGRFISRDPLNDAELLQGPNLYWYAQSNPANGVDPKGTECCNGTSFDPSSQCCFLGKIYTSDPSCACGLSEQRAWECEGYASAIACANDLFKNTLPGQLTVPLGSAGAALGAGGRAAGKTALGGALYAGILGIALGIGLDWGASLAVCEQGTCC